MKKKNKKTKNKNFLCCPFNRFFSVLAILLVTVFGSFFWLTRAEGNITSFPNAYVVNTEGGVSIKKGESEDWEPLKGDMEIEESDRIKTDESGKATVIFYDNSIVHVDSDTEIIVREASVDYDNYTNDSVNIKVDSGRVWSRILQLMDKSSSFQVESSNTVATVRGTAFDFHVTPEGNTEIVGIENEIEVTVFEEQEGERKVIARSFLAEETETTISGKWNSGKEVEIRETAKEKTGSDWFIENSRKDEKHEEEISNKKREELRKIAKILPDSKLYEINKDKEALMLLIAKSSPKKLHSLIANAIKIRLAEAQILVDNKEVGAARKTLDEAEELFAKYQDEIKKEEFSKFRYQIKNQIELQQRLMNKITIEDAAFEIKKQLEKLEEVLVLKEDKDQLFSRIRHLENRLEEDQLLRIEGRGRLCSNLDRYEQEWREVQYDSEEEGMEERAEFVKFKIDNFRERYCQETKTIVNTIKVVKKIPVKSSKDSDEDNEKVIYRTKEVVVEKESEGEEGDSSSVEKYPVSTSNGKRNWGDDNISKEDFIENTKAD